MDWMVVLVNCVLVCVPTSCLYVWTSLSCLFISALYHAVSTMTNPRFLSAGRMVIDLLFVRSRRNCMFVDVVFERTESAARLAEGSARVETRREVVEEKYEVRRWGSGTSSRR